MPKKALKISDKTDHITPKYIPHLPGIRPDGIGRFGSLIASTCRSNQSFTAWLDAQTKGPVNTKPKITVSQWSLNEVPEVIAPHKKAHMGGNHVIGFKSSRIADAFILANQPLRHRENRRFFNSRQGFYNP